MSLQLLARTAAKLGFRGARAKGLRVLPRLWFVTDPVRTPDPARIARRLPPGAAVIYRAFGAPDALAVARSLRTVADRRKLILLVGADAALAVRALADGIHLPERWQQKIPALRRAHPGWLITAAAHDASALRRGARFGADALLFSTVFPSRSASAGPPIGPVRFSALIRRMPTPVVALGGVNAANAPRLIGAGAAGLAAVEGLTG